MLLPLGAAIVALCGRARRLRDGQVLRRDLPRPAARGRSAPRRTTPDCVERLGLVWLALGCVLLGLFPVQVIACCDRGRAAAGLRRLAGERGPRGGCWRPCRTGTPPMAAGLLRRHRLIVVVLAALRRARSFTSGACAAGRPWDCGFVPARRAHAGHGGGIRPADPPSLPAVLRHPARAAEPLRRRAPATGCSRRSVLARPVCAARRRRARGRRRWSRWLQQGRIATYLLYSFVTLVVLLALVL